MDVSNWLRPDAQTSPQRLFCHCYSAARDRYEDAFLITRSPAGTPQEALDTACTIHLAGIGHEPGD